MTRIWRYVLKNDIGRAPCIDDGILTLCCCKPRIRKSAKEGEWVIGLAPKRFGQGLVSWAGRVSDVMPMGAYGERNPERSDAIYRPNALGGDGREVLMHVGGNYHNTPRAQRTDVSGINSLTFSTFWYFGRHPKALPSHLLDLSYYFIGQTTLGSSIELAAELEGWLMQWPVGVLGEPRGIDK